MRIASSLLLCLPALLGAAVYQAPAPEPTPEEVLILECMNRFRADPAAEAQRILAARDRLWFRDSVDWEMFRREVEALEAAPPLVFDLAALDSARKHSYYMIHNGLGHVEQEGKEGYVAKSFAGRMKAAGFRGSPGGENCFAAARSPEQSSFAFIVDAGRGGPGGMQPGRGHRTNMIRKRFNVVGPGVVPHGERLSVTHNFGARKGRFAGGVVYVDKNRNGFYDLGEGRGGVTVATADGRARCTTWPSGAYTLRLPDGDACALVAEHAGQTYSGDFPAGSTNVKFDWIVPPTADLERADELIAAVEGIAGEGRAVEQRRFAKQIELYLTGRRLCLDAGRRERIAALAGEVGAALDEARAQVDAAIAEADYDLASERLREHGRTYRRTAAARWFSEAEGYIDALPAVVNVEADPDRFTGAQLAKLDQMLESYRDGCETADFRARFGTLRQRVRSVRAARAGGGARSRR